MVIIMTYTNKGRVYKRLLVGRGANIFVFHEAIIAIGKFVKNTQNYVEVAESILKCFLSFVFSTKNVRNDSKYHRNFIIECKRSEVR